MRMYEYAPPTIVLLTAMVSWAKHFTCNAKALVRFILEDQMVAPFFLATYGLGLTIRYTSHSTITYQYILLILYNKQFTKLSVHCTYMSVAHCFCECVIYFNLNTETKNEK